LNFRSIIDVCKKYHFIFYCLMTLILPDICMRSLLGYGFFNQIYVKIVSIIFTLGWSAFFIGICVFLMSKKWGKITFTIISMLFIILSFCEYVYFNIFGQFFWIKSIMLASEGADYIDHAINEIDARLIIFALVEIFFLVMSLVHWKKPVLRMLWHSFRRGFTQR